MMRLPLNKKEVSFNVLTMLASLLLPVVFSLSCNQDGDEDSNDTAFVVELLARPEPDECFCGIGAEDNGPIGNSITGDCSDLTPEPPLLECMPKTSDGYMWSLTKIGNHLWFGTLQNVACVTGLAPVLGRFQDPEPFFNDNQVCEFGESRVASSKPNPFLGDHRTPKIYTFNTTTNTLEERSVDNCEGGAELLESTIGLRQAGSLDNGDVKIVIFGGASISESRGYNMFAFDPETFECIGAKNLPEYYDGRKMIAFNGNLYAGVAKSPDNEHPAGAGRVLRWAGNSEDPLLCEEVGNLATVPISFTVHEGRLFAGTWNNGNAILAGFDVSLADPSLRIPSALFMSPLIPPEGLTSSHSGEWVDVWNVGEFEPYPFLEMSYGMGELTSFMGHIIWGTINRSTVGFLIHATLFEPDLLEPECEENPECLNRLTDARENTRRVTTVFRGRNFESSPVIELLYGESSLPVFIPFDGWISMPNNSFLDPIFGPSGFYGDKISNIYTWSMATYRGSAFLGTADAFQVTADNNIPDSPNLPGGDLYRFKDLESPAEPITIDAFGFGMAVGFRTMVSDEDGEDNDDGLYLGVNARVNLSPESGWKLFRLK